MKILSVNAGLPRAVEWRGHIIKTSIWKSPVEGRVRVRALNIDGDEQSDLSVHGGEDKAVYVYPHEHYAWWRAQLCGGQPPPAVRTADGRNPPLPLGVFGENFTTEGLLESEVRIGDRLRAGTAEFIVTQPRFPCFKLGIRFGSERMIARFHRSRRSGFYLAVAREGDVAAGDAIEIVSRDPRRVSILDVYTTAFE